MELTIASLLLLLVDLTSVVRNGHAAPTDHHRNQVDNSQVSLNGDSLSDALNSLLRQIVPDEEGGTSSISARSGLSSREINDIVDLHNKLRLGEGSSNMEKLTWNSGLASLAQQWADRCVYQHGYPPFSSATVGHSKLGQNLYVNSDLSKGATAGVQAWFDEKPDYNYNTGGCRSGKQCGHYTQVVWAATLDVGCGMTKCNSVGGLSNANYLICNYGPPGNWKDQKPFKRGSPCTACDTGKFYCTNNLCDSSCSSQGSSSCRCNAQCGSCGTPTKDCKCQCKPGWSGVACDEECRDTHAHCGASPGWPSSWCDSSHQFVLDNCPKLCRLCQEASNGQQCRQRNFEQVNDRHRYAHDSDDMRLDHSKNHGPDHRDHPQGTGPHDESHGPDPHNNQRYAHNSDDSDDMRLDNYKGHGPDHRDHPQGTGPHDETHGPEPHNNQRYAHDSDNMRLDSKNHGPDHSDHHQGPDPHDESHGLGPHNNQRYVHDSDDMRLDNYKGHGPDHRDHPQGTGPHDESHGPGSHNNQRYAHDSDDSDDIRYEIKSNWRYPQRPDEDHHLSVDGGKVDGQLAEIINQIEEQLKKKSH